MRIGINLLWLVPGDVGGSEEYSIGLVRALARNGQVELVVFCQPALLDAYPDLGAVATVVVGPPSGERRSLRLLWESTWLPYEVRRHGLGLVHHLGGTLPSLSSGSGARTVLTIYDLQPLVHPERFAPAKRLWLRTVLPRSARRADAVLTMTEHVRQQVVEHLGTTPERTLVAPPGIDPSPSDRSGVTATQVRQAYGLAGDLLLYPAIAYAHKNHDVLVRALPALLERHPGTTLVCTGRRGPNDDALDGLVATLGVGHAVRRLGRIPRADVEALYGAATALVFPSTYEGFGLPLVEAMARGLPIVASRASAIPEVVAGSGELLDAHDPAAWADALGRLLGDPVHHARMAWAAARGASRFSWDTTAATVVDLYRSLSAERGSRAFGAHYVSV